MAMVAVAMAAVAMVAGAMVAMDVATVAWAVAMAAGVMAAMDVATMVWAMPVVVMDMESTAHLAAEDAGPVESTEKLPEKLNLLSPPAA